MSLWSVAFYSWFVFMALAVLSVIGVAVWESKQEKKRRKGTAAEAPPEKEPPQAEPQPEAPAEAEPSAEDALGDLTAPGEFDPLR